MTQARRELGFTVGVRQDTSNLKRSSLFSPVDLKQTTLKRTRETIKQKRSNLKLL